MKTITWKGEVTVLSARPKALLVVYENEKAWIPKSLIHADSEVWSDQHVGETGTLVIPEWLAEWEGWL